MSSDKECPRCRVGLHARNVSRSSAEEPSIEIDRCNECKGLWLDRGELSSLIPELTPVARPKGTTQMLCPTCHVPLTRAIYSCTDVAIDLCKSCSGTWLDAGEFKSIKSSAGKKVMACTCGKKYRIAPGVIGKSITCRQCSSKLQITESGLIAELPPILGDLMSEMTDSPESKRLAEIEKPAEQAKPKRSKRAASLWHRIPRPAEIDVHDVLKYAGYAAIIAYVGFLVWYLILPVEKTAMCEHKRWVITVQIERLGQPHWSSSKRDVYLGEWKTEVDHYHDHDGALRTRRSTRYWVRTYEPIKGQRYEFAGEDNSPTAGKVRGLQSDERIVKTVQYFVTFDRKRDAYSDSIYRDVEPGKAYKVTTNRQNADRIRSVVSEVP